MEFSVQSNDPIPLRQGKLPWYAWWTPELLCQFWRREKVSWPFLPEFEPQTSHPTAAHVMCWHTFVFTLPYNDSKTCLPFQQVTAAILNPKFLRHCAATIIAGIGSVRGRAKLSWRAACDPQAVRWIPLAVTWLEQGESNSGLCSAVSQYPYPIWYDAVPFGK